MQSAIPDDQPQWDPMPRPAYPSLIKLHTFRILIAGLTMGLTTGLAGQSIAADDEKDHMDDRWIPSIAVTTGFTSQRFEGGVVSRIIVFGADSGVPVRPDTFGQQYLNAIHAGGQFELQTPALPIPHVRPRFFFGGEVHHVSSQIRKLALEREPRTELTEPNVTIPYGESAILGVGSQTTVDADNLQFGAHIGISFPVQIGDLQISIKPSARYLKQKLYFTGIVSGAERDQFAPPTDPTNHILTQGSDSLDVHAVGPGLEIEIDAGGVRSLGASIFVSGGAYRVLTEKNINFSSLGFGDNAPPFTAYRGTWTADIDPWIYRASVGLRIKWTGAGRGWLFGLDR